MDRNHEQRGSSLERRIIEQDLKNRAHLLEFFGDVPAIPVRAIGDHMEVRAANLAPGLGQAFGGLQQRKTCDNARQQSAMGNKNCEHRPDSRDALGGSQQLLPELR